jgi:hypothetical protein
MAVGDGDLYSYPVPNLVQGVSQQTSEQRRETQCEEQFDCINRPVNGVEARPPVDVLRTLPGLNFSHAFCHELVHGDEHYLAVFTPNSGVGTKKVRVYDLATGEDCTITFTANQNYLATNRSPRDVFRAATLEDYTFIANRLIRPSMDASDTAPAAKNESMLFFRAGGYKIKYTLKVTTKTLPAPYAAASNKVYTFTYTTPNNSLPGNAKYITTNQLASTFFKAIKGSGIALDASGAAYTTSDPRTSDSGTESAQGVEFDASAGEPVGAVTLPPIGFYARLKGNVILLGRDDTGEFTVDTSDGAGDTHFRAVKDQVQDFNDLPERAIINFVAKVKGTNREVDDDYWVQFKGATGASGYWEEVPKPGVEVGLYAPEMLHALVNTGYQTFEWIRPPWGDRVCGDGETKSKNPSFLDTKIEDLFYSHNRLAILSEGTVVWSKNRNPFVFFQTSAQTDLPTDPIDVEVGGGEFIAILKRAVRTSDSTFLWSDGKQFRVTKAEGEGFSSETIEILESSAYDWTPDCRPKSIGKSMYFVSEPGEYCVVRDVLYKKGELIGDTDVTAHVPKYIPKGARLITGSDHLGMLFIFSDSTPNRLYAYNFLVSDTERLQSAWNIWRLPTDCAVVWAGVRNNRLYLLLQRTGAAVLAYVDLSVDLTDPQDVRGIQTVGRPDYLTRVDLRLPEGQLLSAKYNTKYNSVTDTTALVLPFKAQEARGDTSAMFVVTRETARSFNNGDWTTKRGHSWEITDISYRATTETEVVTVKGDASATPLYVGFRISAERLESEFHVRGSTGVLDAERVQVTDHIYSYAKTGYFRAEVTYLRNTQRLGVYPMEGRSVPLTVSDTVALGSGKLKVAVNSKSDEYNLRLINDSYLPSRWTALKVPTGPP